MLLYSGGFIVAMILSCALTSFSLTTDEVAQFFTTSSDDASSSYTWSSASYTGNLDLTSEMTITDKVFTRPNGKQLYYHYFQSNGIPNYSKVSSYTSWSEHDIPAAAWDIQAQTIAKCIPKNPSVQANDACTDVSGFVGITTNGTPLWTYYVNNQDTVTQLDKDSCGGHPNSASQGKYHYHGFDDFSTSALDSGCLSSKTTTFNPDGCPAPFIGVALDGFPIYGPQRCESCLSYAADGSCDTTAAATGMFDSTTLTNGGRAPSDGTQVDDSGKDHAWEYRLHTDPSYHISCLRGTTAAISRCTGALSSDAKKREDENLAEMEITKEEEELEELEKELLENKLQLLLESLLKRGKE